MRQILYVSESTRPVGPAGLNVILQQSRHNNALDGVTGLLWSNGRRFVQVIEGDERAIDDTMGRIRRDPRHHDIVVLHDLTIAERQFGDWTMELRDVEDEPDQHDARMRLLLEGASDTIRTVFARLVPRTVA